MPKPDEDPDTQQPATPPDAGGTGGTFTQEQLNQIVADRAKRAEEAALKKHFESLGVKDADELKALVQAKKDADDAAKTELQKQADRVKAAEEKAAKLELESAETMARMQRRILDSEIKQNASRQVADKDGKVTRPAFRTEALDDILLVIDRTLIKEENGKYEGIEKALEALAKAKPFYLEDGKTVTQSKGTPKPGETKLPQQNQPQQPARPNWTF